MKLRIVIAASVLLLSACPKKSSDTKGQEEAPQEVADKQEPAAEPTPAQPEMTREERVAKAIERVPKILEGVAELRGLPFKKPIEAEYQTQEDFGKFVHQELKRDLPPEKAESLSKAMYHLGFLKEPINISQVTGDALLTQAGAYYDPKQEKFFMVMVLNNDLFMDILSAHELTHGLQDQHFDLDKYYYGHEGDGPPTFTTDELNARRFVVEGEATFVMTGYGAFAAAKKNLFTPETIKSIGPQFEMMASMDIETLRKQQQQHSAMFGDMGDDIKKSMEAMDFIPLVIMVPLLEAYTKGALPIYEAFKAGGWDRVAQLYSDPPQSTEQVLHPATKLIGERDLPVKVTVEAPKGWKQIDSDVLGELGWRVYFMIWEHDNVDKAADGWDGDRYAVYEKDGALLGLAASIWDSEAEAAEFAGAYLSTLKKRFPEGKEETGDFGTAVARPDGSSVYVKVDGSKVFIADGAKSPAELALALKAKFAE
ncbi:MAG: hypothetical protein GY811_29360 [Myxococcales bacterium]|nr:hypothetical protein [Myxococcales bacterium]